MAKDPYELVQQVIYYGANPPENRDEASLHALLILKILGITDSTTVWALAPFLNDSDKTVREDIVERFSAIDKVGQQPLQSVNYLIYRDYIKGRLRLKESVPEPFIEYIYQRSPGNALLAYFYAHEDTQAGPVPKQSEILWGEHIIADAIWKKEHGFADAFQKVKPEAIEVLRRFSQHKDWWVRLYVVKVMQKYSYLHAPDVTQRLTNDRHELVKQAIGRKERLIRQPRSNFQKGFQDDDIPPRLRPKEDQSD